MTEMPPKRLRVPLNKWNTPYIINITNVIPNNIILNFPITFFLFCFAKIIKYLIINNFFVKKLISF